ncbi:MAG: hypothetical protein ACRC2O_13660, partial [Chitinophagaceae bacterium]
VFAGFSSLSFSAAPVSPRQLFEKIAKPVMEKDPNITEFEICIENTCESFDQTDIPRKLSGSGPTAVTDPSQVGGVADAVGDIIGKAAKTVGVGGKLIVDYEKKPDGYIKVHVEASFGTGTGAAAGASGSNPDTSDK